MNYCSIQDAWGQNQNDYITNQYKKYNSRYNISNNPKNTLENFSSNEIPKISKIPEIPKNHLKNINNCNNFFSHLNKCKQCQRLVRNKYRPKILENFSDILDTNKDIVVLILVGICIMLFFNLVNSATKNIK
jgi:hypothetical protein